MEKETVQRLALSRLFFSRNRSRAHPCAHSRTLHRPWLRFAGKKSDVFASTEQFHFIRRIFVECLIKILR